MPSVAADDVGRSADDSALHNLVVVGIRSNDLELTSDRYDSQHRQEIRQRLRNVFVRETKPRSQLLGNLGDDLRTSHSLDDAGPCQLQATIRIALPAKRGKQHVGVEDHYWPHGRSSWTRSSINASRSSSDMPFQSSPRSAQSCSIFA